MKRLIFAHASFFIIIASSIIVFSFSIITATLTAQGTPEFSKAEIIIDPSNKKNISGHVYICYASGDRLTQSLDIKRGLINLKEAMLKWTDIDTRLGNPIWLSSPLLKKMPFVYVAFDRGLELTEPEKKNIREYLLNGGFMVLENISRPLETNPAVSPFEKMFKDVIRSHGRFAPIHKDHPLYYSFFDFTDGPPRGAEINMVEVRELEGVTIDERLVAIYSRKRYVVKWNERSNNEPQLRMGVNMLVFALRQKGGIAGKKNSGFD